MTIAIGTKFIKQRGKHTNKERVETVTDILKTYNLAGELVKTRYVAEHDFLGQTVTDSDVLRRYNSKRVDSMNSAKRKTIENQSASGGAH